MNGEKTSYTPLAPGVKGRFRHDKPFTDVVSPLLCDVRDPETYNYLLCEAQTAPADLPEKGWNRSDIFYANLEQARSEARLVTGPLTNGDYSAVIRAAVNAALNER